MRASVLSMKRNRRVHCEAYHCAITPLSSAPATPDPWVLYLLGSARSAVSTSATRRSVLLRVDRRDACKRWFRSGAAGGQVCCEPEEADRRRTWASHGGFCVSAVGRIRRTPEGCVYASGGKSVQTWALTHCLTSKSSSPNSSKSIPPSSKDFCHRSPNRLQSLTEKKQGHCQIFERKRPQK